MELEQGFGQRKERLQTTSFFFFFFLDLVLQRERERIKGVESSTRNTEGTGIGVMTFFSVFLSFHVLGYFGDFTGCLINEGEKRATLSGS